MHMNHRENEFNTFPIKSSLFLVFSQLIDINCHFLDMLHTVPNKSRLVLLCCLIAVIIYLVTKFNKSTGEKALVELKKSPSAIFSAAPAILAPITTTTTKIATTTTTLSTATITTTIIITTTTTTAATTITTTTTSAGAAAAPVVTSTNLCYPPNGQPYTRDQLPPVNVSIFEPTSIYVSGADLSPILHQSSDYNNLSDFIQFAANAISTRRWIPKTHSVGVIFRNPPFKEMARPSCDGLWMEFGVFRGATISHTANWKKYYCGENSQPVYGFDTFTGLPTNWRPGFTSGAFVIPNGTNITVPSNVVLVKGLFIDTLPDQLRLIDRAHRCHTPVSYVHIDCDIYDGTRDVLFLLGSRLVKGSVIVFDELFNYPGYEKHEVKALFEFLSGFNIRLKPLGASGDIILNITRDISPQSFGFVVD